MRMPSRRRMRIHAVHARDLRRAGSGPFQSLRLALSDAAPRRTLSRESVARSFGGGGGTGLLLDRAATPKLKCLVLLDANRNCLDRAAQRLARFKPALHQVNLLAPLTLRTAPVAPWDSLICTPLPA